MSIYTDLCDDIVEELVNAVPTLQGVEYVHRYAPQDAQLLVNDGGRHIAVFPIGEGMSENVNMLTTKSVNLVIDFEVVYWEPAGVEPGRVQADEEAAAEMYEALDAVRLRFLDETNMARAGAWRIDWLGAEVGTGGTQDSSMVRWFRARVRSHVVLPLTP